MNMRTITRTIYLFDELSEEAQRVALEKLWDLEVDHEWWEFSYDYIREVGEALGFTLDNDFYFDIDRGSYFSFDGRITLEDLAENWPIFNSSSDFGDELKKEFEYIGESLEQVKRLLKWNCVDIYATSSGKHTESGYDTYNFNGRSSENVDRLSTKAEVFLFGVVNDFRNWALSVLKKEYEYLTSEECVKEGIRANEYEFYENGEMI